MWKTIALVLEVLLKLAALWHKGKPQRDTQDDREDITNRDTDAVSARIDKLLTKARNRAERS